MLVSHKSKSQTQKRTKMDSRVAPQSDALPLATMRGAITFFAHEVGISLFAEFIEYHIEHLNSVTEANIFFAH